MIPMTQHIIECVHKLSQRKKMPGGMKVTSKTGVILYDNSWLPGVQYESTDEVFDEDLEKMKQMIQIMKMEILWKLIKMIHMRL
jgi:hypothetical protein